MAGAPKGNKNAAKGKQWEGAIRRGLAKDRERLYRIAEQVLTAAEHGEQWAVTEIRNTLDGKPTEHVHIEQDVTVHVGDQSALAPALGKALDLRTKPTVQ